MKILLAACSVQNIFIPILLFYDLQAYASDYADHIVLKGIPLTSLERWYHAWYYRGTSWCGMRVLLYIWTFLCKELMADLIKILPRRRLPGRRSGKFLMMREILTENSEFKGVMVGKVKKHLKNLPDIMWKIRRIWRYDRNRYRDKIRSYIMDGARSWTPSSIPFIYKDLSRV